MQPATWQNETVTDEEERFWMRLINVEMFKKNPDCGDKDRVRDCKWRVRKGRERLGQLDKVLKIDREEESQDMKEYGFSIQHALNYLHTLSLEDQNTYAVILGVIWNKPLPPRTKKEQAEFNQFREDMKSLIDALKDRDREGRRS